MANYIQTSVTVNSVVNAGRNSLSSTQQTNTTSSAGYLAGETVVGTTYLALNGAITSFPDVLMISILNDPTQYSASVVAISGSSSGGVPIGCTLIPGSQALLPTSQSITSLSAKVVGGWPIGTPTPTSASLAWVVQGMV
jgi:hypothetical protein